MSTPVLCVGIGGSNACGSVIRKSQKHLLFCILTLPLLFMNLCFVRTENCSTDHCIAARELTVANIRALSSWICNLWSEACQATKKGGQVNI